MKWLKEVLVDIIVSLFIIASVVTHYEWMRWIIIGYTIILAFAKTIVLIGDDSLQLIRKTKTGAPDWFNHLLYGINTLVLLYAFWWYLAGGWIMIWILSTLAMRKLKSKVTS